MLSRPRCLTGGDGHDHKRGLQALACNSNSTCVRSIKRRHEYCSDHFRACFRDAAGRGEKLETDEGGRDGGGTRSGGTRPRCPALSRVWTPPWMQAVILYGFGLCGQAQSYGSGACAGRPLAVVGELDLDVIEAGGAMLDNHDDLPVAASQLSTITPATPSSVRNTGLRCILRIRPDLTPPAHRLCATMTATRRYALQPGGTN